MNRYSLLILFASTALLLSACGSDSEPAAESAQQAAQDAAADAADAAQGVADQASATAGEISGDMADAVSEAMDDAGAAVSAAMDDAGAAVSEAMDDAGAAVDETVSDIADAADDAVAGAAATAGALAAGAAGDCALSIEVGDNIAYSTDTLTVPSSCAEVTVTITHTGQLPAVAMGHNWVLVPADALNSIAQAGQNAGAAANYVPDDDRIVAATAVVGGGESASVTFSLDALQDGVSYRYVCTFPGHWAVMQGDFSVSG